MNNVGFFEAIWLYIWNFIKNSVTYKFLKGIYDGISRAWQNSAITSWFRREHFSQNALSGSFAGKIFRFPFTITEKIREKSLAKPNRKKVLQRNNIGMKKGTKQM